MAHWTEKRIIIGVCYMLKGKTCRKETLEAVHCIIKSKGENEFSVDEVLNFMKHKDTSFKDSTIRTHITSRCYKNAPDNHGVVYEDYLRIRHGLYKLLKER